jgi:glycosyltransferase involved in cell wall biosynthesis
MKISIITVCFNSAATIRDCIGSVMGQKYPDFEYIVVDGGSRDQTVEIIKQNFEQHPGKIKFVSEKDRGIYDAMNKGIGMATGDVVGFLNADDFFADSNVVRDIADTISLNRVDGCFADLDLVREGQTNEIIRHWVGGPMPASRMEYGWHPAHPTLYVKKDMLSGSNGFQIRHSIAADYEFMVRLIMKNNARLAYLPRTIVKMRAGGASNGSLLNIYKANLQCISAWRDNGLRLPPFLIPGKLLWKVSQRIRSFFN